MMGEKNDELYVRHIQYGVMSPINRLHSSNDVTTTKEPWFYKNGAGAIAQEWLRFRHELIPYLYSASKRTNQDGIALVEPLYYEWDSPKSYQYKNEYLFGGQLLVAPVTKKANRDGYARVKAWIPEGVWFDIFTGDRYVSPAGGTEKTLLRTMESIPVLIKAGGILPLSKDEGNFVDNPEKLDVRVWSGDGEFTLFEDGRERNFTKECTTEFTAKKVKSGDKTTQTLKVLASGDSSVFPKNRTVRIFFEDITPDATPIITANGEKLPIEKTVADCASITFPVEVGVEYVISVEYGEKTDWEKGLERALNVLRSSESANMEKLKFWNELKNTKTAEEYVTLVENAPLPRALKLRLKETL